MCLNVDMINFRFANILNCSRCSRFLISKSLQDCNFSLEKAKACKYQERSLCVFIRGWIVETVSNLSQTNLKISYCARQCRRRVPISLGRDSRLLLQEIVQIIWIGFLVWCTFIFHCILPFKSQRSAFVYAQFIC